MINVNKLTKELIAAGISTHGNCNSKGVVWDDQNREIQDREDVKLLLKAHDPTPEEKTVLLEKYSQSGITTDDMIRALWKKVMQSDDAEASALQAKIDQVIHINS